MRVKWCCISRRTKIIITIWLIYLAVLVIVEAVVPLVDPSLEGDFGYLPLLFFLPIFFPSRYRRRSSSNSTPKTSNPSGIKNQETTGDSGKSTIETNYTTPEMDNFDNYGISYRRRDNRLLYIAGIGILAVSGLIIIYFVFLT